MTCDSERTQVQIYLRWINCLSYQIVSEWSSGQCQTSVLMLPSLPLTATLCPSVHLVSCLDADESFLWTETGFLKHVDEWNNLTIFPALKLLLSWEICQLRDLSVERSVSWEMSIERSVSWEICQLRDMSVERSVSWEICQLRDMSVERYVNWEICQFRDLSV